MDDGCTKKGEKMKKMYLIIISLIIYLLFFSTFSSLTYGSNLPKMIITSKQSQNIEKNGYIFQWIYSGEVIKTNLKIRNEGNANLDGNIHSTIPFLTISPTNQFSIKPLEDLTLNLVLDTTDQDIKEYEGKLDIQSNDRNIEILVKIFIKPKISTIGFRIGESNYIMDGQLKSIISPAFINNGRTMAHLGFISAVFDVQVEYDHKSNGIVMTKRNKVLVMQIDNEDVGINGKFIKVDVPPVLHKDLVFVPLRFLVENFFDSSISWEPKTQKITIIYDRSK